jgi:uncharacterized protein
MKLDLSEILAHVGMRYPYAVDEKPIVDEDLECSAPITGEIVFSNTGSVLLVEGAVETKVTLPCSRCLAYYEEPVRVPISEQFQIESRPAGPRGRPTNVIIEEDENPDAGRLFDGPLFDLTELLRQGIMLALPSQPLHDEACKGLCAICGKNLNDGSCQCKPANGHPALAQLGALLENKDNG